MELFTILLLLHIIGTILAVGGATASDALFLKSIKNKHISKDEFKLLHEASKLIWTGLVIAVLSGIGFLLNQYYTAGEITYWNNAFFQAKVIIVTIVFLNGLVFHGKLLPLLKKNIGEDMREKAISSKFWLFSLTGTISIVSWWSIVILAVVNPNLPLLYIINAYLLLIAMGTIVSYLMINQIMLNKNKS